MAILSFKLLFLFLQIFVFPTILGDKVFDGLGLFDIGGGTEPYIFFNPFLFVHDLYVDLLISELIALLDQLINGLVGLI